MGQVRAVVSVHFTLHEPKNSFADFQGLMNFRFMVPMHAQERMEALHEPLDLPPGFGLRQPSGAFKTGPRAQKRQRTAAVQDASASAAASSQFVDPMLLQRRKETLHESERGAPVPPD